MKKVLTGIFAVALLATALAQANAQAIISAQQARETALAMTGGGAVSSIGLTAGAEGAVYQIVIINNGARYEVSVCARTGEVIRLSFAQAPAPPVAAPPASAPAQVQPQGSIVIGNVVPRRTARSGGPANPPISAQRAVELARDHLVAIGVTYARFDYVYMDIERGVWVWSVEFDGRGRSYEFYVNVNTGAFLEAPSATGGRGRR